MTLNVADAERTAVPGRKTVTTGVSIELDLLKMVKSESRRQGRAMSSVFRDAVRIYLRERGYDPPTPFEFLEET